MADCPACDALEHILGKSERRLESAEAALKQATDALEQIGISQTGDGARARAALAAVRQESMRAEKLDEMLRLGEEMGEYGEPQP